MPAAAMAGEYARLMLQAMGVSEGIDSERAHTRHTNIERFLEQRQQEVARLILHDMPTPHSYDHPQHSPLN